MRIKEISERFNIPAGTLRYYEKIGLFDDVKRVNGIREYEDKDIRDLGMHKSIDTLDYLLYELKKQ